MKIDRLVVKMICLGRNYITNKSNNESKQENACVELSSSPCRRTKSKRFRSNT